MSEKKEVVFEKCFDTNKIKEFEDKIPQIYEEIKKITNRTVLPFPNEIKSHDNNTIETSSKRHFASQIHQDPLKQEIYQSSETTKFEKTNNLEIEGLLALNGLKNENLTIPVTKEITQPENTTPPPVIELSTGTNSGIQPINPTPPGPLDNTSPGGPFGGPGFTSLL